MELSNPSSLYSICCQYVLICVSTFEYVGWECPFYVILQCYVMLSTVVLLTLFLLISAVAIPRN